MKNKKIIRELLELGGSLIGLQKRVEELLTAVEAPLPNPRKRRNLKQIRVAEINDYRATQKFKKQRSA